jgi:hypothetical protein
LIAAKSFRQPIVFPSDAQSGCSHDHFIGTIPIRTRCKSGSTARFPEETMPPIR